MPAHTTTQRISTSGSQPLTLAVPGQRFTAPKTEAQHRRDHLDRLLGVRSQLARLVAERRSHRMDDETDVFSQQLAVEGAIHDLDLTTYEERWPSWVEADVTLEHEPTTLVSWCSLCRAVATRSGVNLLRPEPPDTTHEGATQSWDPSESVAA